MATELILSQIPILELEDRLREIVKQELLTYIPKQEPEQLLSPEQTRHIFNPPVSLVTLNKWNKQKRIQSQRIGGRVYYKRSEIIEAAQRVKKYNRGI